MKKKLIKKLCLISFFSLLMVLGLTNGYSSLTNVKEQLISKQNCRTLPNGQEICDDCDKAHDSLTGTSGIHSDKNPPCETRDRDCWPGHVAYYSWGCGCVECSDCDTSEPEPEEYYCYDSSSTFYSLTCSKTSIKKGENASCTCNTTTTHTCYSNTSSSNNIKVDSNSCGQKKITCGDKTTYVDVKCPACYRKNGSAHSYTWAYDSPGSNYTKITSITSEAECKLTDPTIPSHCIQSNTPGEKGKDATSCASSAVLPLDEEKVCSDSITSQFYTINCRETVSADFIPGNLSLKAGQGFVFDVKLSSTYTCEGLFNNTEWNNTYSKLKQGLARANKLPNGSDKNAEVQWYSNKITQLESFYTTYRSNRENYMRGGGATGISDAEAKLVLTYKYKNKNNTLRYTFITKNETSTVDNSQTKYTNNMTLSNGQEVKAFKSKVTKVRNLIPPKVAFNKDGSINTSGSGSSIDGGNHFMTELNTDPGNYSISIEINNLGVNHNGTIKNNNCNLNVHDRDYQYRIIDVNNPFNIQGVAPGENWISNDYDFESTVNSSTWSDNYLYKFDLSKDDIKEIKNSNNNYFNAYLGLCDMPSSTMDAITKKICENLK